MASGHAPGGLAISQDGYALEPKQPSSTGAGAPRRRRPHPAAHAAVTSAR